MASAPRVGLPTDRKLIGQHPFLATGEKYVRAVVDGAGALPLLLPALQPGLPLRELLEPLDGLLLTGAVSNIEPHHYSDEPSYEGNLHDPARDANTLPLISLALELGLPVLAVCRGFQEVNVALGGSLHQKVHEVPGFMDHRENPDAPLEQQYAPAHTVTLNPGGILAGIAGTPSVQVNSLHGQGVARLGRGLKVEAVAPDGLIEGFRHAGDGFLLGVQWHPEWQVTENPFYLGIFRAFGDACRAYARRRAAGEGTVSGQCNATEDAIA
ncbi:gamma-glutamyl-gamma-aminobutyrate hydrolase [Pseudoxanthomonas kalamensis DSM 18571]|uniref:gamma-glutamyl-gamma-aminobutyrate hydrolase family protein n=1 Tax=Pseudoxanthomonas kalamensis TaxID=289483 RepID=UPI001391D4E2|nr:gamma-glutamyl-gamma-aminobutyrate hydrolase family protein [Pseudoxanthomonas kalamensis]KAF1709328.1 gamma-glutamyl-gamma-aminobutyrate hydrolase [Pseudoxanthomonas kalamensis DSM 18571]